MKRGSQAKEQLLLAKKPMEDPNKIQGGRRIMAKNWQVCVCALGGKLREIGGRSSLQISQDENENRKIDSGNRNRRRPECQCSTGD